MPPTPCANLLEFAELTNACNFAEEINNLRLIEGCCIVDMYKVERL
jgi:hypothetical protein